MFRCTKRFLTEYGMKNCCTHLSSPHHQYATAISVQPVHLKNTKECSRKKQRFYMYNGITYYPATSQQYELQKMMNQRIWGHSASSTMQLELHLRNEQITRMTYVHSASEAVSDNHNITRWAAKSSNHNIAVRITEYNGPIKSELTMHLQRNDFDLRMNK